MMRTMVAVVIAAAMLVPLVAQAQEVEERDFAAAAESQEFQARVQQFVDMGMDEKQAMFFTMMTSGDMDPAQMMLLMMMMDGGGRGGGEAMGVFMLMNAMGQSKSVAQPVVIDRGEMLLIIEGGVLYKINPDTMEIVGRLAYAKKGMGSDQLMEMLMPMIQGARGKAQRTACMSNMRQLAQVALMYAQDHDEALPPAAWVAEIEPYHLNAQILVCPSRPELPVGYAMNEKVQGVALADIANPSETILFFEMEVDAPNPAGGPDLVPEGGIHDGGICVGYVDGHVKWVTADVAREELERDPFE